MPYYMNKNNERLYYSEVGIGQPIIFIHGLGGNHNTFEKQIGELSNYYRCISVDLRGYGKSDDILSNSKFSDLANDIIDLVNYLELEKSNFVGISMGGMILQSLMIQNPEIIDRVVLISTSPIKKINGTEINISFVEEMNFDIEKIATFAGQSAFPNDSDIIKREEYILDYMENRSETFKKNYYELNHLNNIESLKNIKIDTLIIHGIDDPIIDFEFAKLLNHIIRKSSMAVLKEVGHTPHRNAPNEVTHLIYNYFRGDVVEQND